jgi:transcriptional regulator with XRE-family HTH domain
MEIAIVQGGYGGENSSHHLELTDFADELRMSGYQLTRVERGRRNTRIPIIDVNFQNGPANRALLQLPIEYQMEPYESQEALNVKVTLVGLRQQLAALYGMRQGNELGVRVFIPNYEGDYLQPNQGDERVPPEDGTRPRNRVMREIAARRGAPAFRNAQLDRFGGRCAVSECGLIDVLEAAHIRGYRFDRDNARENGVLLRADLHTLFDLDLLAICPETFKIAIHEAVQEQQYRQFHDCEVRTPDGGFDEAALRARWALFRSRNE